MSKPWSAAEGGPTAAGLLPLAALLAALLGVAGCLEAREDVTRPAVACDGCHGDTASLAPPSGVWLNGKKEKLAKGRKNRKAAEQRLVELRFEATRNPAPEVSEQTVASIIETYWGLAEKRLAESTLAVRIPYLQSFAEMNGWRTVAECKPFHMESWLNSHPEWISDWTKLSANRSLTVPVPFTGLARKEIL